MAMIAVLRRTTYIQLGKPTKKAASRYVCTNTCDESWRSGARGLQDEYVQQPEERKKKVVLMGFCSQKAYKWQREVVSSHFFGGAIGRVCAEGLLLCAPRWHARRLHPLRHPRTPISTFFRRPSTAGCLVFFFSPFGIYRVTPSTMYQTLVFLVYKRVINARNNNNNNSYNNIVAIIIFYRL